MTVTQLDNKNSVKQAQHVACTIFISHTEYKQYDIRMLH